VNIYRSNSRLNYVGGAGGSSGRSIVRSRNRYGKIVCPGAGLLVRGFGRGRRSHQPHQPLHPLAIDGEPVGPQHRRHPPRAEKRHMLVAKLRRSNIDASAGAVEEVARIVAAPGKLAGLCSLIAGGCKLSGGAN
jgi:hypothetical protein